MRRWIGLLLIFTVLVACGRKEPEPEGSPTPSQDPTLAPQATSSPVGSPVPRITIVPSATRFPRTPETQPGEAALSPTGAVTATGTPRPTSTTLPPTPTSRTIDAGATATPSSSPSPEPPVSPLPTPTLPESPLGTPEASSTSEASAGPTGTPTPTLSEEAAASPTNTPSPTLTPADGGWGFENLYTYYDEGFLEFYIWGEAVNRTGSDQTITSIWPVVYGQDGEPVNAQDDVDAIGSGYKDLREGISLAPEARLAFSFRVELSDETEGEENYEILLEAEPGLPARDDLDIVGDDFDDLDWPFFFYVEGEYNVPEPELSAYLALVVTLYDEDQRVIGLGWLYEEEAAYLTAGEHEFFVEVEMWDIAYDLELEVYSYKVQVFGR